MVNTEGEVRARFPEELSAQHFADIAQARQAGEMAAVGSCTDRCYQMLARDEYNTWCLLDRYLRFHQSDSAASPNAPLAWMREVLAWLEGMVRAPAATGVRCGWDKTCQGLSTGRSPPGTIDAMDPDACSRQQRAVHRDDRKMEDEFLRTLWTCVRAGDVSRAQACCRSSQQWWRAASLTPAAREERGEARRLWKAACRDLAQDDAAPSFERAVYAVLSADPAALQAFGSTGENGIQGVLSSWYDKVYVWAKVWVDSHDDMASVENGRQHAPAVGEEMQQSLNTFLQVCNAAQTEEDSLAGAVANTLKPDVVASIAESWVNSAIRFYRGAQEVLIFTVPIRDDPASCLSVSQMWNDASGGGVFPPGLRWPLTSDSWSATDHACLPPDVQQLGEDLSSQLTRTALHAGILLSQSTQTRAEEATSLITAETKHLGISYIELLAASVMTGDSESLTLVAEYTNWLPQDAQADTLLNVLKSLPSSAWKSVLENPVLQPTVVAEVRYKIVQHVISSSASDDDKVDALQWACSTAVNDGHDGLLMRLQGLRLVNGYLRIRLLEEGVEGLTGQPPYTFLDVGKKLCGAEMSDCFEAMCEYFPQSVEQYNTWLQVPQAPVAYLQEMADVSFASCQDDFREYRCWQVLLDGQHCVTEFGPALSQGVDAAAEQQQRLDYERTKNDLLNALYLLVSFEGRWMLDISARPLMNPKNGETFELRVLKPLHYQYFGWLSGARAWLHVLILAGAFRHAHSLDLIEIIAREDSPLFHDFEPSMLKRLLSRVPAVLIRIATQDPQSDTPATSSRHNALCKVLLST